MSERGTGRPQWSLNPYEVSLSFAASTNAARQAPASTWFGPLDPVAPGAPRDVAGRQWDYPSGYNLWLQPRPQEAVTFATMRSLADSYDILRLVIETRKDQVARLAWTIRPRQAGLAADPARSDRLAAFFQRPDGIHGWADWLRMLLEELFVIDAPALYMQRDRAGRLIALMPLDGATIKPVIDGWGRTPQPAGDGGATPYPVAYQQILKGFPAVDYSTRDLLYRPRNPRVNRAYGFSPVEQVVTTVNIALRRQLFLLDYFTDGNIPDSLIGVPETWTPDQIASYQKYWDAYFSGDLARRRRAKFVPGGVAKTFIQTKEPELKSLFDDWLARIVCYAFSVSPQPLVQTMNRATAEVQKDLAEEEGLAPILFWVKALVDELLGREFDAADMEFAWTPTETIDPQVQETILSSFTGRGILTINEARAALGRTPLPEAAADRPMALTGTGYVPLSADADPGNRFETNSKGAAMAALRMTIPITKVDALQRLVYGVATAEVEDRAGEICDYASTKPLYETWSEAIATASGGKSLGNLRAMHGAVAAGKVTALTFNDQAKQIEICAKVVDDDEWIKVTEGVYTGFSQGGSYARRWTDEAGSKRYTAEPHEISLVDMPCLSEARFEMIKVDGSHEWRQFKEPDERNAATVPAVEKNAEPVLKAGARNSEADQARIQKVHDAAVDLGARCGAHKMQGDDLAKQFDALAERLVTVLGDVARRLKVVEDQPQPLPLAMRYRAVQKQDDAGSDPDARLDDLLADPDALSLLAIKLAQRQRR